MAEKLTIAGAFMFFLLVAAGVAISSNDPATQLTYAGEPGIDAVIHHVFYGLNFAVMVVLLTVIGFIAVGFILMLTVVSVLIGLDRVIKPLNAIDSKIN